MCIIIYSWQRNVHVRGPDVREDGRSEHLQRVTRYLYYSEDANNTISLSYVKPKDTICRISYRYQKATFISLCKSSVFENGAGNFQKQRIENALQYINCRHVNQIHAHRNASKDVKPL